MNTIPVESWNAAAKAEKLGGMIQSIQAELKPEAVSLQTTTASGRVEDVLGLLLVLSRRIVRKQQPAEDDKTDRHPGDRKPGSELIHLMTPSGT
jgi:hypothetical protein